MRNWPDSSCWIVKDQTGHIDLKKGIDEARNSRPLRVGSLLQFQFPISWHAARLPTGEHSADMTACQRSANESTILMAMITALEGKPKFSQLFMAYLLGRNSRIEKDLIDELFNSSEKRLARLLLLLANFGKEASPQPIASISARKCWPK